MKIFFSFFFVLLTGTVIAQCGNGNTFVSGSLTPPGVGQSTSRTFNSGQYMLAYVQGGANYQVSTCGGTTGGGPSYDTQLTIYADATGSFLGYNDDNCSLQSSINFTPSFCGYVRVLLHQYSCNGSNLPWNVTMTQNTAGNIQTYTLSAIITQTNVSCFGLANGSAQVNPTGVTGAVQYSWAPSGGTNALATGLSPGIYTVTARDATCQGTIQTYTITQPTVLAATNSQTNVSCFGASDGVARVNVSGGNAPYSYTWSPSGGSAATESGLAIGTYTNRISDANGCALTRTFTLTQPLPLVAGISSTGSVSCLGGSNGVATVTVSGGTSAYTYSWTPGGGTLATATGLSQGNYTVTVTDAHNCITTATTSISEPATAVSSSTAVTNILCNGTSTGSATITASGGTPGYSYLWSTAATASVVNGQPEGVITATVTDANGCSTTNTVSITQPATSVISTTATANVLCHGGSTGSATVTASGGTTGYSYLWSTAATSSVITGEIVGIKTVTVTDANGCITTNTVIITEPAALTSTITSANVLCNGGTGTATVTASGGTGSYTYVWSNSAVTSVISALVGTYSVTVTDANLCTTENTVSLTQPPTLTLTAVANSSVICAGNASTLTASGSGGTGIITYTWVAGPSTQTYVVSPAASAIYTVNSTDVNNCAITTTVELTVNINPTVSVNSGVICSGNSFTMVPSGASTYTYSSGSAVVSPVITTSYSVTGTSIDGCVSLNPAVSTVTVNTSPVISVNSGSICSGSSFTMVPTGASTYTYSNGSAVVSPTATTSYSITGSTTEGCISINTAVSTVTVFLLPPVSIAASNVSVCPGNSSTLTATGATSYTWNTGVNSLVITVTPAVVTIYSVTGSDAVGCINTATQTIGLFPSPSIMISSSNASVCTGFSSTLTASGVSTYTWNTGSTNASISVAPVIATSYSVIGTDLNNCVASNSITIGISITPTLTAVVSSTGICTGFSSSLNVSGATSYVWSNGLAGTTISVSPVSTTVYTVTGTNGAGCVSDATVAVTVYTSPTVSIGADVEVASGTTYQFNPAQSGAASYEWSPATYLSSTTVASPVVTPESDMTYVLTVSSDNGCMASDTVMVKVLNDLVMANYMSPNGDGQNDTWKVSVPGLIKDYSVTIIDGYGKTVFSVGSNYNNEFDGKLGGQDLPDGVYYYFIKDGNDTKFKGSITLTK